MESRPPCRGRTPWLNRCAALLSDAGCGSYGCRRMTGCLRGHAEPGVQHGLLLGRHGQELQTAPNRSVMPNYGFSLYRLGPRGKLKGDSHRLGWLKLTGQDEPYSALACIQSAPRYGLRYAGAEHNHIHGNSDGVAVKVALVCSIHIGKGSCLLTHGGRLWSSVPGQGIPSGTTHQPG